MPPLHAQQPSHALQPGIALFGGLINISADTLHQAPQWGPHSDTAAKVCCTAASSMQPSVASHMSLPYVVG